MKFLENGTFSIPNIPKVFVYFLLLGNDVVYVGKTKNGIVRPFSHKNKKFDEIRILLVEDNFLDISEEYFIIKYSPIYNLDLKEYISFNRARNIIREYTNNPHFSVKDLKLWIKNLNIIKQENDIIENSIKSKLFWDIFQNICSKYNIDLPIYLKNNINL